jgi:hypothetical protein
MVQREPLFEWPAEGDLAVCIVDPHLGAVVKRGIFRDGQHLEYELKRIVAD